ncbi:hypothetical protein [Bradyrhizobium japonicum]|uniref:hypothetical protein n=1 Tax=Bradyrhizobium japonicum TaxID=375 RepID=UPI00046259A6|nr:hypothetical protein [Bradyrhizobium japonicum]
MRLVAEVVDKYSGPLKSMMDALKKIGDGSRKVHDEGRKHVNQHHKAYHELREQMAKVKETTTDVLRPAFNALGLSALSVAGGIAAVSEAVKGFGEYGEKLEFAHRASGLMMNSVRGLAEANQKYGVSTDETIKSLEQFGAHMDELHRRSPAYINAWKALGANAWRDIGSPLAQLDGRREEQLRKAMELIPRIRDVDQRKRVLGLLGLPENWAYLTDKEMQEMRRKSDEFNRRFPFNAQAAHDAKHAWDELLTTFRGLKDEMSSAAAPGITEGLKSIQDFVHDPEIRAIWNDINDGAKKLEETFKGWGISPSLKSDLQDIKAIIDGIKWFFSKDGKLSPPSVKENLQAPFKKFGLGSDDKKAQENVKEGTRQGLEEFFLKQKMMEQSGMFQPTAFNPGGMGARSRGGYFGSKEFPAIGTPGAGSGGMDGSVPKSMGKGPDGSSVPMGGDGLPVPTSGTLAEQRKRFAQELEQKPWLRDKLLRIAANEQGKHPVGTQNVIEETMNRAIVRGTSLEKEARWTGEGGYYAMGNMGRGALENPSHRAILEQGLKNALAGSNSSNFATDNASSWLAAKHKRTGNFTPTGPDVHGETFFGPDNRIRSHIARWQAWKQGVIAADQQSHGARLSDMIRRGRRGPSDAELLKRGMRASDAGSLNGNAKLDITLNGFPKGTRTAHHADGIFKQVQLNRGRPMLQASETS